MRTFSRPSVSHHRRRRPHRRRPQHLVEVGRHLEAGQVRRRLQEERHRNAHQRGDEGAQGHPAGTLSRGRLHYQGV